MNESEREMAELQKQLKNERIIVGHLSHSLTWKDMMLHTALGLLRGLEWIDDTDGAPICPSCYHSKKTGHDSHCKLAACITLKHGESAIAGKE